MRLGPSSEAEGQGLTHFVDRFVPKFLRPPRAPLLPPPGLRTIPQEPLEFDDATLHEISDIGGDGGTLVEGHSDRREVRLRIVPQALVVAVETREVCAIELAERDRRDEGSEVDEILVWRGMNLDFPEKEVL